MKGTMNILFGKGKKKPEPISQKDDSLVVQSTPTKTNDDDDELILCSTNKSNSNPTLLTQTVQNLFGKPSKENSSDKTSMKDEKLIEQESNGDEQLIDLS